MFFFSFLQRVAAVGAVVIGLSAATAEAATYIVTNTDDSGAGSLRQAILNANGTADVADTIRFNATVFATPQTITLTSDVPNITSSLDIVGPPQKGARVTINDTIPGGSIGSLTSGGATANFSVSDLTFTGNIGGVGHYASGTFSVQRCTFFDIDTGSVVVSAGSGLVQDCTFLNNVAGVEGIGVTVRNCTFVGNRYGIFQNRNPGSMTVESCTIAGNTTGVLGAGSVAVSNSLVVGNTTNTERNVQFDAYSRNSGTAADAGLQTSGGANAVVLQDNGGATDTIALLPESSAIDAGNSALTTDQRGRVRPVDLPNYPNASGGNGSDIGAFEYNEAPQSGANLVVNTVLDGEDGVCGSSSCTLREAVNAANGAAGDQVIGFDNSLFAPDRTITLTRGDMEVAGNGKITINSPTVGKLTLSGNNSSRIFRLTFNVGAALSLNGLTLTRGNNSVGGAISNRGTLTIDNCTFTDNTAPGGQGGAIDSNIGGTLTLSNSTFVNNSTEYGGAINSYSPTTITNCTFTGNSASVKGGAIFDEFGTTTVRNCIVVGNTAPSGPDISGTPASSGHNLIGGSATEAGLQTDSNGAPVLADNGGKTQTVALVFGSPAINAGATDLTVDQRGIARPQRGADDIGAFEFENRAPSVSTATISPSNPKTNDTLTATPSTTSTTGSSDPDGDTLSFTYVWKNGDTVLSETGPTLDLSVAGNGDKGDSISVTVTATDSFGASSAPVASSAVTVQNSAPEVASATITPGAPSTTSVLTANVNASDADGDGFELSYQWQKNDVDIVGATGATLDLGVDGNGDDGDTIRVIVTATETATTSPLASAPVTSASVSVAALAPSVVAVAPQGVTDAVGNQRIFTLTVSDPNGAQDITEMWLLINTTLNWDAGATIVYFPKSGELYLRRGDAFVGPIKIGAAAGAGDVLDNGALRIVGSEVFVTPGNDGLSLKLSVPATIRNGLVGNNTLFGRVQDVAGAVDASAPESNFGFKNFGSYTVTSQFAGSENTIPTLSAMSPKAAFTVIPTTGTKLQTFVFYAKDEDGIGDLDSLWFMVGKQRDWTNSATFVFLPRSRRLYLRSDDGQSFLGGGQIGTAGIIENSQVKVDLSQVQYLIYADGKNVGLRLTLQPKAGLIGQNNIWLRVQDNAGATSTGGDDVGFVQSGTWNVTQQSGTINTASPSAPGS